MSDDLGMLAYKVYQYAALNSAQDMRDNAVSGRLQQVQLAFAKFGIATAWYNPELLAIPWETMKGWLDSTPDLKPYRLGIEDLYRQQAHVLTADKEQLFKELRIFIAGGADPVPTYAELTDRLGITKSTLRSHVTRLRARYREALRSEVRRTVDSEQQVDQELRELLHVLTEM